MYFVLCLMEFPICWYNYLSYYHPHKAKMCFKLPEEPRHEQDMPQAPQTELTQQPHPHTTTECCHGVLGAKMNPSPLKAAPARFSATVKQGATNAGFERQRI